MTVATTATVDRTRYDALCRIHDELQGLCGNGNDVLDVALLAVKQTRDAERPTIWIENADLKDGQPKDTVWHVYPRCGGMQSDCPHAGRWGATGVMPEGHVLVRWTNGHYLAHLRVHDA